MALVSHSVVALLAGGPVAVPDVSAYLTYSQWLYGGVLPENIPYFPGYGLLLAPFGWLDGSELHTAALLVNGFCAGAAILLTRKAVYQLGCQQWVQFAAPTLAMLFPAAALASRTAWPEMLIGLVVVALFVLLLDGRWILTGLIAGLVLSVHPRMSALVVGCVAAALCHRSLKRLLVGLTPGLLVTATILTVTDAWPDSRIQAAQTIGDGISPIVTTSGQWLALAAGTAGLSVYGLVWIVVSFRRGDTTSAHVFLAVSAIGMLLLGGWVLAGSSRVDTILYGRYMDPWALPLTIVALAALSAANNQKVAAIFASTLSLITATVCFTASSTGIGPARTIMTLSLGSLWQLMEGKLALVVVAATAITLVGISLTFRNLYLTTALAFLLSVSGTAVDHVRLHQVGQVADGQVTTAKLVPRGVECLAHDQSAKSYALWLYRLELPQLHHHRVHIGAEEIPCQGYVIATSDTLERCEGALLLGKEPRADWGLWKYPMSGCG